jgi:hypothetical protein
MEKLTRMSNKISFRVLERPLVTVVLSLMERLHCNKPAWITLGNKRWLYLPRQAWICAGIMVHCNSRRRHRHGLGEEAAAKGLLLLKPSHPSYTFKYIHDTYNNILNLLNQC